MPPCNRVTTPTFRNPVHSNAIFQLKNNNLEFLSPEIFAMKANEKEKHLLSTKKTFP